MDWGDGFLNQFLFGKKMERHRGPLQKDSKPGLDSWSDKGREGVWED